MLKTILTEMYDNEAFLTATLVSTGHLDANSSPERLTAVMAEMRADLEAAGIGSAPVAPAAPSAPAAKA